MKTVSLKKVLVALSLAGMSVGAAHAASVTGTANANVLTPLSIVEDVQMDFGDVAGDKDNATTVTLGTNGTVTAGAGAYAADNGAAGQFIVTGAANVAYTLTMPASITLTGAGADMTVTTSHNSAELLDGTGAETFQVGGTLAVGANQTAGAYSGTYAVTVAY